MAASKTWVLVMRNDAIPYSFSLFPVSHLHWLRNELQNIVILLFMYVWERPSSNRHCDGILFALYATSSILLMALVTCLLTCRTMAWYFEFLSQFYDFHLIRLCILVLINRTSPLIGTVIKRTIIQFSNQQPYPNHWSVIKKSSCN
jgi:hypothetical protein